MDRPLQPYMDANRTVMDAILRRPTPGVPTAWINIMQHSYLDRIAAEPDGTYVREPERVYLAAQRNMGVTLLDQYIPTNPLSIGERGYENPLRTATTGAEEVILDGLLIDSPEAVVEHLERFVFPALRREIERAAIADVEEAAQTILKQEIALQETLGSDMLKTGYSFIGFPGLPYSTYGYASYFMAYALYPEVMERHFSLQGDLAVLQNRAAARLYERNLLPPLYRLDYDIADSRGTLPDIRSLDRLWLPHFVRSIDPLTKTDVNLIWHCDGNLMQMVPRLLEAGIRGFQGFQYEDGMDYEKICQMKTRDGESLLIWAGVSVTRTLPFGTPDDVRREMKFLVENGPKTGLFLGASSSIVPGVPWANMEAFIEGLAHYRNGGHP